MMKFQEPEVEFVPVNMELVTLTSGCEGSGNQYTCDDDLMADFDICNCYPSGSGVVTQL